MKYTFSLHIEDSGLRLEIYRKTIHTVQPGESWVYNKRIKEIRIPYFPFSKLVDRFRHREIIALARKLRDQDDKNQVKINNPTNYTGGYK